MWYAIAFFGGCFLIAVGWTGISLLTDQLWQSNDPVQGPVDFIPPPALVPALEELPFASPDCLPDIPAGEVAADVLAGAGVP